MIPPCDLKLCRWQKSCLVLGERQKRTKTYVLFTYDLLTAVKFIIIFISRFENRVSLWTAWDQDILLVLDLICSEQQIPPRMGHLVTVWVRENHSVTMIWKCSGISKRCSSGITEDAECYLLCKRVCGWSKNKDGGVASQAGESLLGGYHLFLVYLLF